MIAGPNQTDRTLIELYANKLSSDPAAAAELFTEGATAQIDNDPGAVHLEGRRQIHQGLAKRARQTHRVIAHLQRQGEDNYAEILTEGPGVESRINTVRFRTDGHSITEMEMVGSRKP